MFTQKLGHYTQKLFTLFNSDKKYYRCLSFMQHMRVHIFKTKPKLNFVEKIGFLLLLKI